MDDRGPLRQTHAAIQKAGSQWQTVLHTGRNSLVTNQPAQRCGRLFDSGATMPALIADQQGTQDDSGPCTCGRTSHGDVDVPRRSIVFRTMTRNECAMMRSGWDWVDLSRLQASVNQRKYGANPLGGFSLVSP